MDGRISYHASHEQHPPSRLLDLAQQAEQAGFDGITSSDHLTPWGRAQGESGFAWSWLGAAMATTSLPYSIVNAPGQRYHPAVIAQAMATLLELFPGRLTVAFGSGEASNEHVTGDRWPDKASRNERLLCCVEAIRGLLRGEEVSREGPIRIDRARLWTLPERVPDCYGAALSEATARWCGGWADGLVTLYRPLDRLRPIIDAFREGGGDGRPVTVQVKVAWDRDEEAALAGAHEQWRTNVFDSSLMADLELVEQFEHAARYVRPEDMRDSVLVTSDLAQLASWLREAFGCGADHLAIHHVPRPQQPFIDAFGEHVLDQLRS